MAKLEDNEDIVEDIEEETTQDIEEVEESNDEIEEETQEVEDITYEQALEWKKRLQKAEKKLVDLKKQAKTKEKQTDNPISSKDEVKKILAEERFYDKNPEAELYRKEIEKYQTKGLSLEDAYLLASKKDKEVEQRRETYWQWLVKWSVKTDWISTISIDDFDRMTPQSQDEYTKKMTAKYWKVKFK